MGTWSERSFGNDDAGDWIVDLTENANLAFIEATLQATLDKPDDSGKNACAIAAAEVLCMLDGKIPAGYNEDYDGVRDNLDPVILQMKPLVVSEALRLLALKAMDQILRKSELKELWEEDEAWMMEINALKDRLKN